MFTYHNLLNTQFNSNQLETMDFVMEFFLGLGFSFKLQDTSNLKRVTCFPWTSCAWVSYLKDHDKFGVFSPLTSLKKFTFLLILEAKYFQLLMFSTPKQKLPFLFTSPLLFIKWAAFQFYFFFFFFQQQGHFDWPIYPPKKNWNLKGSS